MELQACLDQCSLGLLRQIADAHHVPLPDAPTRGEAVHVLLGRMLAPGYLRLFVDELGSDERRALAFVAAAGGQVRGFVLERLMRRAAGIASDEGQDDLPVLAELLQSGLLYRTFRAVGPVRGEVYVIPDELLPDLPADPSDTGLAPGAAAPPAETCSCSSSFNLFALASFVRRWRQRESRTPQHEGQVAALTRETAELAIELPGRSSRERWTLLAHLGLQLGLFVRKEGGLQPTEALEEWLGLGERAEHQLWSAYEAAQQWNDLERAGSGGSHYAGRTADPPTARAQVLDVIRSLPSNQWLLVEDIEGLVRERAPDFLREGFEVTASRLVDLQSGEVLGGHASWARVEAPVVRYLLSGPLYWLGVLEWGLGADIWDRVRLTRIGRDWLDGSDDALAPSPLALDLGEDRHITAVTGCDLGVLWQLEPYLEMLRRGPPSEYVLSRASFARGLEAGGSRSELLRLLERSGGRPPSIAYSLALERWNARVGRFKLRPMVVLTADDSDELDALMGRAEISGLLRERLGPTAVGVTAARAIDLAEALVRLGQIPQVDAALRLTAGRRAYSALVDQQALEALLFAILLLKSLKAALADEVPHADRLAQRLEQALGAITAGRIRRRARSVAASLRRSLQQDGGA